MPVSFDTVQSSEATVASTTSSVPITPSTVLNRLAVAILHPNVGLDSDNTFVSWGDTTIASDSFELIVEFLENNNAPVAWYLLNPDTGAHTVKFEYESTSAGGMSAYASVSILYDVPQLSSVIDTTQRTTAIGSTASTLDMSLDTDGLVVDAISPGSTTAIGTPNIGQTAAYNVIGATRSFGVSYESVDISPEDIGWTWDVAITTHHLAFGIAGLYQVSLTGTMASSDIAGTLLTTARLAFTGAISSIVGTLSLLSFPLLNPIRFFVTALTAKFGQSTADTDNVITLDTDSIWTLPTR